MPEIAEILRRLARGEPIQHFETERVRRNGERFPVSLAISPVRDATGEIIGASTVARDISEARRLTQALALQRSMLEAQSEASLDGIAVFDLDGRLIFSNARLAAIWRLDGQAGTAGTDVELIAAMSPLVIDAGRVRRHHRAGATRARSADERHRPPERRARARSLQRSDARRRPPPVRPRLVVPGRDRRDDADGTAARDGRPRSTMRRSCSGPTAAS